MIQVTPQMRILVAADAVDFRKGIDGLARVCREEMKEDPFCGYVFVFCNRRKTTLKILTYDGQGFWLCTKRLSKGRFRCWPKNDKDRTRYLDAYELQMLLWNGTASRICPLWKKLPGTCIR